jgi:2-polyprenyl-3-methyl-5-hydroxy-6-metoxy-1,4-benzoquinol methylase
MPPTPPTSQTEKNRAYYSDLAPGMDDYWRKMAAPRFRVATLLELIAASPAAAGAGQLIDLGCGNGQLLSEIAARFPQLALCGADIAEPQLVQNRQHLPSCGFFAMDVNSPDAVPAELGGRFAIITASEVIEHLDRPEQLLQNAYRLAQPGGRLLLSTQSGPVRPTEQRVGHLRHFTAAQLRALLTDSGWAPLRVWNSGFPFHDLSKWYANRNPEASLREFAGQRYGLKQELLCLALRIAFRFNSQQRGAQLFAVAERADS